MKEKIKKLANAQKLLELVKDQIAIKQVAFYNSIKDLTASVMSLQAEIAELKATLGEAAIANFKETKSKSYLAGIAVKEYSKVEYDYTVALNWAIEKKLFLSLSKKEFEAAVSGGALKLDFVKQYKEPGATFPKQLKVE